jgi:hypothetical protein
MTRPPLLALASLSLSLTLAERLVYHLTPRSRQHDFFYRFLANRFDARGQRDTVLRERNWAVT